MKNKKVYQGLIQRATELKAEATALVDVAEADERVLTSDERVRFDAIQKEMKQIEIDKQPFEVERDWERGAPAVLKLGRGDDENKALAHFFRTGDTGGVKSLLQPDDSERGRPAVTISIPTAAETRYQAAVVDSTMNITTAADGKNVVPIGFVRDVATRKNEIDLTGRLGLRNVPGKGTTVNYPVEGVDPEVFGVGTEQDDAHAQNYERDAGVTNLKPFTLAKRTRKVELTEELLDDEDVNLNAYIADRIGRQIAKTHNVMLLLEVATNGTLLKTFASATAIAGGEPEAIMGNDALGYYLADGEGAAWVMRPSTHWAIQSLTGNFRLYAGQDGGGPSSGGAGVGPGYSQQLLGYPVNYSQAAAAPGANAKDLYFGAWNQVGYREDPVLRFIMDPYTVDGMVILKYSFRAVYGVLQAAAVGYTAHPSA